MACQSAFRELIETAAACTPVFLNFLNFASDMDVYNTVYSRNRDDAMTPPGRTGKKNCST